MEGRQARQDLAEAIVEEIGDMSTYAGMAARAADPLLQVVLMNIGGDEYGHARTFSTWQELIGTTVTSQSTHAAAPARAEGGAAHPPLGPAG